MPKTETMTIPLNLARLLLAEPEDIKSPNRYEDIQKLAKEMLKVLYESQK